jgi:GntR family transcriptional regulator, galactonate operon transcriptional repressor
MSGYPLRGRHGDTVRVIGRRVVDGHYQPGATLDPEALAAELGVSRTVLREALKVLSAKGLIDARPTRGTYVLPRGSWNLLDPDLLDWHADAGYTGRFLAELTELRLVTEPSIAGLASGRRTADALRPMAAALTAMRAARLDRDAFVVADVRFHQAVLRASRNELLSQIGPVIEAALRAAAVRPASCPSLIASHQALFEQIRDGDGPAATASMRAVVQAEGGRSVDADRLQALPA